MPLKLKDIDNEIMLSDKRIPVCFRWNYRAKRLVLRIDRKNRGLIITIPKFATLSDARAFIETEKTWILCELSKIPNLIPFEPGVNIPILGETYLVCHAPNCRGGVWIKDKNLYVSGRPEHLARRLQDWLRKEAKRIIRVNVEKKVKLLNLNLGRIIIKDTKTRWGSCSAEGNLNFSWRILLMPPNVFDYIITHEVAHLAHHNHGPNFWALVRDIDPTFNQAKSWLKKNGDNLHRYG